MKVYVVETISYEPEVLGVYATVEAAKAAHDQGGGWEESAVEREVCWNGRVTIYEFEVQS